MTLENFRNGVNKVMPVVLTTTKYTSRLVGHIAMWMVLFMFVVYFDGSLFTETTPYTGQELKTAMSALIKWSIVLGTVFFGLGLAFEWETRGTKPDRVYHTLSSKHGENK